MKTLYNQLVFMKVQCGYMSNKNFVMQVCEALCVSGPKIRVLKL